MPRTLARAAVLASLALPATTLAQGATYDGRARQTEVAAVRQEASVTIDGRLDEAAWGNAARLTGFSLYQPVDQRPAPDSTEVLVWYSATHLHIGVRALEPHGAARATLADRDRISGDDNVEIHLDTWFERRHAFVFIVNPLGVQADGTKNEGGGFIPGANVGPGEIDLSADLLWESRGRVTDRGYDVEIRIPFSSLRYPGGDGRRWGIQVVRNVQHSGYELTWTPAIRASASFIAQAGTLTGLTGMRHGQVIEAIPELTHTTVGAPRDDDPDAWRYRSEAQLGGNIRWTLGSNWVLNGAVKPDFSQVEADATQIAEDPRFALFYPEKRPFFVEGSEQFNVPNTLVYTRRIVQPAAAAKLTGKLGSTEVALLSAVDDRLTTPDRERPLVNVVRLQRSLLGSSTAGMLLSDRRGGGRDNTLVGADARILFGRIYFAQFQAAASVTEQDDERVTAPLWEAMVDRTGRRFGFNYRLTGIDDGFAADNGFVPRVGYVRPQAFNRFSFYGPPGAVIEQFTTRIQTAALWRYDDFFDGRERLEDRAGIDGEFSLRGGWDAQLSVGASSFAFDTSNYGSLWVPPDAGATDTLPFLPADRIGVTAVAFEVETPRFRRWQASAGASRSRDVDFDETSRVTRTDWEAALEFFPSERLRATATWVSASLVRQADDSRSARTRIPRLRVEYQLARPLFVRVVAQYEASERDALRDPRTGRVLLVRDASGIYTSSSARTSNALRADWLVSYRPNPGTVFFAGYGSTLAEDDPLALRRLERQDDGFFLKASYLLRGVIR
jgi:hypothetical protein